MKWNRLARTALLALALLALATAGALAKVVSAGADFYYLDQAGVLDEALEGEIYFSNQLLDRACGAQVVVVALDTTGSVSIDDYAYELFNKWGIGDSQRDNGFLLLLAIQDEDYYAVCGTNLQSKFSAGTLKSYFDQYLESDFAVGNYQAGVRRFFEAAFARVADTYNANVTVQQGIAAYQQYLDQNQSGSGGFGGYDRPQGSHGSIINLRTVLVLLIILYVVVRLRRRRRPQSGYGAAQSGFGTAQPGNSLLNLYLLRRLFRWGNSAGNFWNSTHTYNPGNSHHTSGWFSSGSSHSSHSSGWGGSSRRSGFGGARGGGGRTSGGGAGRGRH